uniref:Ig-like domain-containing protein n=1 Tax=Amphimedon queenslandica TaxID=400682 RepID=A0A1X7V123_AMPQE
SPSNNTGTTTTSTDSTFTSKIPYTVSPSNNATTATSADSTISVISATVSVLIIVALVLIIVSIIFVIIYRKRSKNYNISSKTDDIDVTPNAGYGMIDIVKNTATENEDGVYERMGDDQVYEQLDEPDLLVARESAADTSSTTYENTTTEPIVTESASLHEKENDENRDSQISEICSIMSYDLIYLNLHALVPTESPDQGTKCGAIMTGRYLVTLRVTITLTVPPPSVSIVADPPTGPIYESTSYLLTCTATVNTTIVNTPVTASVVWTDPSGNVIPTNDTRRQVTPPTGNSLVSMLLFQPIDIGHNDDRGTYTCQMIINSNNSSSQPGNAAFVVTVASLPSLKVEFTTLGSVEFGQNLTLTCTITTVERLAVTPSITFIKINQTDMETLSNLNRPYSITTDNDGSVTNYSLMLEPVILEDGAMYTCMAEFNVTGFNNTDDSNTATYDNQEANDAFTLNVECNPTSDCYYIKGT